MGKKVSLVRGLHDLCEYHHPTLALVCTLKEACYMWGKSEATIKHAIDRGHVQARKSFTGGDWIITTASLEKRYGEPKENTLWQLQK